MSHDHSRSNLDPRKDDGNVVGNLVGEGVGGTAGIAAGAAVGALGGPVGMVIGALAGAVGGWWAGRSVAEGVHDYTDDDDRFYREHHTTTRSKLADVSTSRSYDDVRPAYQLGHLAGRNPDYSGRSFDDVETDLQRGWTNDVAAKHGDWTSVRPYARDAYDRGRGMTSGMAGMAGNVGARVGNALDDMKDRIDGNPASRPGLDSTDSAARASNAGPIDRATGAVAGAAGSVGAAGGRLADKAADTVDDMKDRVDGNPASQPGRDTTDRPGR
ncbi:hypothetical protein [Roseisolibacter agri]|uniref:Glycine zipper domain-containing protein n=1 Tax=Roseisolibacter agri TaxID=2014610 RepID=A0AA37QJ28_9BACT|nr:hypothetical protein [Roseisolibacter agri]GLC27798.1 hypothetical protein rosag_43110 [Roseisolibacter agri]